MAAADKMAIILIKRTSMAASGKRAAEIESLIERFTVVIRSAIRKTCPSIGKLDMDDIEQEVRISVWKEIKNNEKKIANLGSYIWRVSYTTTCKIMKRLTEQRKELFDTRNDGGPSDHAFQAPPTSAPDHQYQSQELLQIVRESIDGLIESRRQVVKLYMCGLSAEEIKEYFDWSDGKARNLLSRGLADLRDKLREKGIALKE